MDWHHDSASRPPHHLHGAVEIAWCRSGSGSFLIESSVETFHAGDVFVIGGAVAHASHAISGRSSDWTFAFIDATVLLGGACDPSLLTAASFACVHARDNEPLGVAAVTLIDEFRRRQSCWRDAVRACLLELLIGAHRHNPRRATMRRSLTKLRSLEPALAWIASAYASPLRVTALARRCGVSPSQLRRLFATQFGCSPQDYLNRHRVQLASGLLVSSDAAIADIAARVGFTSLSSFHRQFTRRHGLSASAWRSHSGLDTTS